MGWTALHKVVYATGGELLKLPYSGLSEGFYVVGTGSTGVAASLATIGAVYAATVFTSSLVIRRPPAGYQPAGYTPQVLSSSGENVNMFSLSDCRGSGAQRARG